MEECKNRFYVMTAKIPEAGAAKFNEYESLVLPLLRDHGAKLEKRLQSPDRLTEVHILWFPSPQSFEDYRNDPRRSRHAHLLSESGAVIELSLMTALA
ncbi:hypothetical protein I8J29_12965 [Paenibacillus sp. MWE-103]|uniref:DUF1330 domain-containing protein n=1 Tax=Paenibacillus artemisiicola TaxID=1172618 RepID=A0ABS3W9Y7_9BACL|nr:hypothetical protein [Paenibacillus artemisiicola]MBO7745113.1 hypothetical protein [Paenibacillus artemisiicola]